MHCSCGLQLGDRCWAISLNVRIRHPLNPSISVHMHVTASHGCTRPVAHTAAATRLHNALPAIRHAVEVQPGSVRVLIARSMICGDLIELRVSWCVSSFGGCAQMAASAVGGLPCVFAAMQEHSTFWLGR